MIKTWLLVRGNPMHTQLSLWQTSNAVDLNVQRLQMPDADVVLIRNAFSFEESCQAFIELRDEIVWQQESIVLFNQPVMLPRLTAWYGDRNKSYTYSNITMEPKPWTAALLGINTRIEAIANTSFNSVLLNLYRDGKDSVAWHSDDEPELGENPVIGSVSFGETRRFMFRHKFEKHQKVAIELTHGSVLLMQGSTQHFWQHQIPKTSRVMQPRINLTFRQIIQGRGLSSF
jgi:alkylated DNA repair dioxygenase AlkB